ncbi:hypothetical protein AVEN_44754-1 [Araneus ventricosus]|uniref:Cuticle protein 10.9 n=1 Tax=Araneus ventricosus TaxID=182803 RepID=A0A4Y2HQC4_ARAVE|nr:hypothetical protein AVEN_44754-1 [Araneus ventricosus]
MCPVFWDKKFGLFVERCVNKRLELVSYAQKASLGNTKQGVSLLALAIFSCVAADEEGNNGPRTGAVSSRSRVPYINFRNEIPAVSHESGASNKVSNEETEISGYLNSGTGRNDIPQSYSFDYKATDEEGNVHYRQEQAYASGRVKGSYGYTDIEGLYRTVSYVADSSGFHAFITTNEPGVDDKESPADVNLIAREPPAGIQENHNEFRGTGVGGMKTFGTRTRAGGNAFNRGINPILRTNIPRNIRLNAVPYLAAVVNNLFKSGMKSYEDKDDDKEPKNS